MEPESLASQLIVGISVVFLLVGVTLTSIPPHFICVSVAIFLHLLGIISADTTTEGFGSSSVLTIASLTITVGALQRTPPFRKGLEAVLPSRSDIRVLSRRRLVPIMFMSGCISAFTNNIPLYMLVSEALYAWTTAEEFRAIPRWAFVGLSYACIGGGMLSTLGTSTHFVVQDLLDQEGLARVRIWELSMVGAAVFGGIMCYTLVLASVLRGNVTLTDSDPTAETTDSNPKADFSEDDTDEEKSATLYKRDKFTGCGGDHNAIEQAGSETDPTITNGDGEDTTGGTSEDAANTKGATGAAADGNTTEQDNTKSRGTVCSKQLLWENIPVVVFVGWISVSAVGLLDQGIVSLIMALILIGLGFIDKDIVFSKQKPSVLLVIAAMLAVGKAVDNSGIGTTLGSVILTISGGNPILSLGIFTFFVLVLTEFVTNVAAAAVMFPVALAIAKQAEAPLKPFVLGLMITASSSFASPVGYPTNMLALRFGGVTKPEMFRVGVGLALVTWLVQWGVITLMHMN
eukprot:gb/GECG01009940.1/.p1 GENE.gb/GECG01009940.1/~~gb/GECG01009940.1/.p1  ORF type:complete len:516 (+),score=41.43 gb/GECG01009940.1/:1-1548(+)